MPIVTKKQTKKKHTLYDKHSSYDCVLGTVLSIVLSHLSLLMTEIRIITVPNLLIRKLRSEFTD